MVPNINTNTLQVTGQTALIAAFSLLNLFPAQMLQYSVPFMQPTALVMERHTILFGNRSPSSYVFKPGMVLGVTATAYSPTVAETDADPFTTASGQRVHKSIIAANFLPLGSRVQIGKELYEVGDRMNPRFNDQYRIDLFRPTPGEARSFGTRDLTLEIVSLP